MSSLKQKLAFSYGLLIVMILGIASVGFSILGPRLLGNATQVVFEGVIGNIERRWRETDSQWMREELSRYQSDHPCDACGGSTSLSLRVVAGATYLGGNERARRELGWAPRPLREGLGETLRHEMALLGMPVTKK